MLYHTGVSFALGCGDKHPNLSVNGFRLGEMGKGNAWDILKETADVFMGDSRTSTKRPSPFLLVQIPVIQKVHCGIVLKVYVSLTLKTLEMIYIYLRPLTE